MAMKKTTEKCFSNGTDFMIWQDSNCCQCAKAVFYNVRLRKLPKYRCAVQEQIEGQQMGQMEVSQRTFDAAQEKHCPFFKSKVEETPNAPIINFAKGESMVKVNNPKANEVVEEPEKILPTNDKALLKVVKETGASIEEVKAAEQRVIDKIFHDKVMPGFDSRLIPPMCMGVEARFKESIKTDARMMLETFTWDENMMIAFVPLVISHLAWIYAQRVLDYCAKNKISEVKKLGRAVKEKRTRYVDSLRKDLDSSHIDRIEKQTKQFFEEYARDFTFLWWACNSQIKKVAPYLNNETMLTDAYCCIMMVEYMKRHNRSMNTIITNKLGNSHSLDNPHMISLAILMDAYFPDGFKVELTNGIDTCLKVLANRVVNIEFGVKD